MHLSDRSIDLLHSNHEEIRHLLYRSLQYIFSFHTLTLSVTLQAGSSTMMEQIFVLRQATLYSSLGHGVVYAIRQRQYSVTLWRIWFTYDLTIRFGYFGVLTRCGDHVGCHEELGLDEFSDSIIDGRGRNSLQASLKPKCSLHPAAFNGRTVIQLGQQAVLAKTLRTFKIDVCYLSKWRTEEPTSVITLRGPNITSFPRFTLRMSGDPTSSGRG